MVDVGSRVYVRPTGAVGQQPLIGKVVKGGPPWHVEVTVNGHTMVAPYLTGELSPVVDTSDAWVGDIGRRLMDGVAWTGGATIDPGTRRPAELPGGYVVGGVVPSVTVRNLSESVAEKFVSDNRGALLDRLERYVGAWDDGERVHLDVCDWWSDRTLALCTARRRGEISVWDVTLGEAITV